MGNVEEVLARLEPNGACVLVENDRGRLGGERKELCSGNIRRLDLTLTSTSTRKVMVWPNRAPFSCSSIVGAQVEAWGLQTSLWVLTQ